MNRILISLLIGISLAFNYVSAVYISMQLEGALRSLWLYKLFDLKALMVLIVGFSLSVMVLKEHTKQMLYYAITALIVSVGFWGLIGGSPVSVWLLPPVQGK